MTPVLADITKPIPSILGDSGHPTCVLLSPVFVEGGARRRRLLGRWGYLAAVACLAYLAMLGLSFTASPVTKPGNAAKPAPSVTDAAAPTAPAPRPPRTPPRDLPPVEGPAIKALMDGDAAQDAALVLRVAPPVTTRAAPPRPVLTIRAAPRAHPRRDNDSRSTTRSPTISPTPVASPTTAPPASTTRPVAP